MWLRAGTVVHFDYVSLLSSPLLWFVPQDMHCHMLPHSARGRRNVRIYLQQVSSFLCSFKTSHQQINLLWNSMVYKIGAKCVINDKWRVANVPMVSRGHIIYFLHIILVSGILNSINYISKPELTNEPNELEELIGCAYTHLIFPFIKLTW